MTYQNIQYQINAFTFLYLPMNTKTKFLKFTIAVILGAGLAGMLYAQLEIQSTIDNSVMTIKQINLTADGKDGAAIITLDWSSSTPLQIKWSTSIGDTATNKLSGQRSSILWWQFNQSTGDNNIVGWNQNKINWSDSVIPGWKSNIINANYSFAAGNYAVVNLNHHWTFVWSDSQWLPAFQSTAPNQFLIRAAGWVAINTNTPRTGYGLTVAWSWHFSGNLQVGGVGNKVQAYRYCNEDGSACVDITDIGSGLFVRSLGSSNNIHNANIWNVGIGTTTPTAKFHVNWTVKLENLTNTADGSKVSLMIDTNGNIWKRTLNDVAFNWETDPVWMSQSWNYVNRTTAQTIAGTKTFSNAVVLSTQATATNHAVRADRTITTNNWIQWWWNLTANRTLSVDSSVVRTGWTQTIAGTKTFSDDIVRIGWASNRRVVLGWSSLNLYWATAGWAMGVSAYNNDWTNIGTIAWALWWDNTFTYYYYGWPYDNPNMVIRDWNVWIGTTTPSTKLQVNWVITANWWNSDQWNTAYGWGDHGSAGYLTSVPLASTTVTWIVRIGSNIWVSNWLISVANGTTSAKWVVQLSSSTSSTSTTLAATPSAVRTAYNLAATKIWKSWTPTVNTITKFANTAGDVTNSNISDNGTKVVVSTDLEVQWKVTTDNLVYRTVENINVDWALIWSAPTTYRNLGSATTGWNKIFASLTAWTSETTVVVKWASNELKTRTLNSVAFNGYTETDPQVSMTTTNRVPRRNGSTLINGTMVDNGTRIWIWTTSPSLWSLQIWTDGAANGLWFYNWAGTSFRIYRDGDVWYITRWTTLGVAIASNWNVWIGTTTPSTKLQVNWVITANWWNSTEWNTAYGWGNHSSAGYLTSAPVTSVAWKVWAVTLVKADVWLWNVTNDAQVKKRASSTSGYVPTWNGTAWNALNNGYSVQTALASSKTALVRADAIQTAINWRVPTTRTVNSKALSENISLTAADVWAVPTTRTVNSKALSANISLTAADVWALSNATSTWINSVDWKPRFHFTANSHTYIRTASNMYFRNAANGTIMTMLSWWNVWIGTTNPLQKLHVEHNHPWDGWWTNGILVKSSNSTVWEATISFNNNSTASNYWIMWLNQWDWLTFAYGNSFTDANSKLRLATNWNVWIWTLSPSYKLQVNWSIGATAFYYSSDISLKKNIKQISSPLEKIMAINWYYFTWKSDDTKDIGLIAQEVEKTFPDAVKADDKGIKSVKYGNLVAPIIEAIKELYTKYLDQQNKIDELEQRLEKLEIALKN